MSHLLGAWSMTGRPLRDRIPDSVRREILAKLPDDRISEVTEDDLWLVAGTGRVTGNGDRIVGCEGFVAGDPSTLSSAAPEGHYNLVCLARPERRLTLRRGLSGGERLYYAELGDLLLFAGSIRYLLAHPEIGRALNPERVPEVLLTGLVMFGYGTLVRGVDEVKAGHAVTWNGKDRTDAWRWNGLLEPRKGSVEELARQFKDRLGEAVTASVGPARPVAVTLSGGIDSSAVAAVAVEAFGADNVVAFTHEFEDPTHGSETPFAVEVCKRLGIQNHVVFPVSFQEFLTAIPETVWRAESFVHWPKAFMLAAARRIRAAGFDRFLSGFGIGSHMNHVTEFARLAVRLPAPGQTFGYWRLARSPRGQWLRWLESIHPGLALPGWRLLLPYLCFLRELGLARDVDRFYPPEARPLFERVPAFGKTERELLDLPLPAALRRLSFERLFSCIDVTRWEKPLREVGAYRVSPAHFAGTIPYAYLPPGPKPGFFSRDRILRPGKLLLRTAMAGVLPDSVLYRKKSWADAVISPGWLEAGLQWMKRALPLDPAADPLAAFGREFRDGAERWDDRAPQAAVTAFRFWHRLFIERPPVAEPPTWSELVD